MIITAGEGMAHESHDYHDYKASAAKLQQLARQVQSGYCRDQLLRIAQGFDRLAKHAEEWPAAPSVEKRFLRFGSRNRGQVRGVVHATA
jgi:hypothetical protein